MPKKQPKYSSLAIAGFVFSLIFFIPLFSIIGIICGISALANLSKDSSRKGKWMAVSAIIIGVLVTILQALVVILIYNFAKVVAGGIEGKMDVTASMNNCLSQKPGFTKDMCIFMSLAAHANQTSQLDKGLCDKEITIPDIKDLCNALLKKDKSYCYNITDSQNRIKCLGLIEEASR